MDRLHKSRTLFFERMSEMLTLHVAPPHAPAAGQEPLTSLPTTAIVPAETETAIVATAPTKVIVREPT